MNTVIGTRLRDLRKTKKFSQQEVATKLNISDTSYQNYEYNKRDIPGDVLRRLASLYDVTVDYILGVTEDAAPYDPYYIDVPLYGSIAAGTPIEMIEIEDMHPVPRVMHERYPNAFLLRVEGESMNKRLPNGVYALIDPCTEIDRDGEPYAICVNGYDATIKLVRRLNNGFELSPDSTDPTYSSVTYNYNEPGTETITPIGRVVYYVLPFDWEC